MTSSGAVLIRVSWLIVLVACGGCGRHVGPMSGVVKFNDGSPVTSGSIELRRTADEQLFASRIAKDGTFHPAGKNGNIGLPPGTYNIVVVQVVLTEDLPLEAHTHGHSVPRRYADYSTSGLQVEIKEGEMEPIEVLIELDDAAKRR